MKARPVTTVEQRNLYSAFEIFEGTCCDDQACAVRECWPSAGETDEQFVERLRRKYGRQPLEKR